MRTFNRVLVIVGQGDPKEFQTARRTQALEDQRRLRIHEIRSLR